MDLVLSPALLELDVAGFLAVGVDAVVVDDDLAVDVDARPVIRAGDDRVLLPSCGAFT